MKPPKPFEIKLIASPEDYTPLREDFKIVGAFNPGVTCVRTDKGLETILYVRVAETPAKRITGEVSLPYFNINNKEGSPVKINYEVFAALKNIILKLSSLNSFTYFWQLINIYRVCK